MSLDVLFVASAGSSRCLWVYWPSVTHMKIFSGGKQLSPASARNCFLVNQFATPGLGSLMGGRVLPGIGQLTLALIGCALVMFWFFKVMKQYYSLAGDDLASPADVSYTRYAIAGFLIVGASWLWS